MRSPQVHATIDQSLYDQIQDLADKNERTLSQMVALLLQQAVKEKTRKRRGTKEDNTEHYASDSRPGNAK